MFRVFEADAGRRLPFWFHASLSPATLAYTAGLTLLGAAVAGVLPALKVTRGIGERLRQAGAGGGGLRLGGVWTAVIVAQVAVTVAFPVTAYVARRQAARIRSLDVGYAERAYLSARLTAGRAEAAGADTAPAAGRARVRATYRELERRLAAEPWAAGVTMAERLPRTYHPARLVEVDAGPAAPRDPSYPAYRVSSAAVGADYFDVLGAPVRAGRPFRAAEAESGGQVAIVNRSFVDRVFGGRNPIGRRVRYLSAGAPDGPDPAAAAPGPWYEIVGVAGDLGMAGGDDPKAAGVYHPLAAADPAGPLYVAVRVRGDPAAFAGRLRAVAAAVDPALRVEAVLPAAALSEAAARFVDFWFGVTALLSAVAVVLSLAGIYAVMAFTVTRRTREIGVRTALGAGAGRVVGSVVARPLAHVGLGVAAGGLLAGLLLLGMAGGGVSPGGVARLAGYAALMLGVCLLACVVPARRALRVPPTEALRAHP
jgi:hypothetical protein